MKNQGPKDRGYLTKFEQHFSIWNLILEAKYAGADNAIIVRSKLIYNFFPGALSEQVPTSEQFLFNFELNKIIESFRSSFTADTKHK